MAKTMMFDIQNIVKVYDGDTLTVLLDRGFEDYSKRKVRVRGVNTPEIRTLRVAGVDTPDTKAQGKKVRDAVVAWLNDQANLVLISYALEDDKYGRVLGDIMAAPHGVLSSNTLSSFLLANGLAKPYNGGTKAAWTEAELKVVDDFEL